jgi:protein-L-isoaspartate(D-aspartate) O-methyltransferase
MTAFSAPDVSVPLDSPEATALRERMADELSTIGDLTSNRVRQALLRVPRHAFVPSWVPLPRAYANRALAIGYGQTISQPSVVAIMTEALELVGTERVLEIGTGSGYQAALLGVLAGQVYTLEIVAELGARAAIVLQKLGFDNVHASIGDGRRGWPERAPFDRIVVTAGAPAVPTELLEQLGDPGILVAPIGPPSAQRLRRLRKLGGRIFADDLGGVAFVPLAGGT